MGTPDDEGVLRRVSVIGSGREGHPERAGPLGRALADLGVHLVTGGGSGVMAEVSRGFLTVPERRGRSIGILPARPTTAGEIPLAPPGYPNPWVEIPVQTHLEARGVRGEEPDSRNHLVVLSGEAVVALPGGAGTLSEVRLALRYRRPLVAHLESMEQLPGLPDEVPVVPSLNGVVDFLRGLWPSGLSAPGSTRR